METHALNVLLVTNDSDFDHDCTESLSKLGCIVSSAPSLPAVAQLISTNLLIVDLSALPNPPLKSLVRELPELLVAVVANDTGDQEIIDALVDGAINYVRKPSSTEALQALIYQAAQEIRIRHSRRFEQGLFRGANLELTLESTVAAIAPTVNLLRNLILGLFSQSELARISLGLEEIIRNAYEHGNLGITFSEKSSACSAEMLEQLLIEREQRAKEEGMTIAVRAEVTADAFHCFVSDAGAGFDWQRLLSVVPASASLFALHGRGLLLARKIFDEMHFNAKGNEVHLVKYLPPRGQESSSDANPPNPTEG